jgi:hypothetical protein
MLLLYNINKMIILYLIIFLIIVSFYYFINNIETFNNNKYYSDFDIDSEIIYDSENPDYDCDTFFDSNSFCQLEFESNKCDCKYQKDDLRYIFNSPETCCKRLCRKISPEKCIKTTPYIETNYYCRVGDKCKEYKGIIKNSKISANYCGNDPLNNQLLLPFAYKEECEGTIDICDKYNIPGRSVNINKAECIKDVNCGFCSNNTSGGKCISGTAEGPNDLQQYFYCAPGSTNNTFSYTYGNHVAYLLQK